MRQPLTNSKIQNILSSTCSCTWPVHVSEHILTERGTYIALIKANMDKLSPNSPPKFAPLRILPQRTVWNKEWITPETKNGIHGDNRMLPYIDLMSELLHWTPCHASPQGSPPVATHPGRGGEPRATYKLLIAATAPTKQKIKVINFDLTIDQFSSPTRLLRWEKVSSWTGEFISIVACNWGFTN